MLSKWLLVMTLGASLLVPASVKSQETPSGKWWRSPQVIKRLRLEKKDIKALDAHYTKSKRRLIDLKRDVEKERFELETMLERRSVDDKTLDSQFQRLEKARTRLASERLNFAVQVRKIIGFERYQELKALYRQSGKNK